MAYYSGTASSLADLRTALLTHAQTDGWVLTGDVLSKAGVFFQIQVTADNITCLGCESNAVANPAPGVVMIGRIFFRSGFTTAEIAFPCNYEVFGFAQELYLVVNYSVNKYQWMTFGKSTVPGLPGQGGFVGASIGSLIPGHQGTVTEQFISISSNSGGSSGTTSTVAPAMLWHITPTYASARNCWVNHNLDAHGWTYNGAAGDSPVGIRHATTLIDLQPSVWNSEATLLPMRAYKQRPSFKSSLILDLEHSRHLRIDNLAPGDILVIGSDKWKVFPFYTKNASARNGGNPVDHTGTFGWAIRYEGP